MAYIGNPPTIGQWRKLDDISGSFNGSTTTFTTAVGGSNVTAGSANQLIVSLGGVIQQPNVDYSVTTNSIIFTTAPASGLDFFAVLAGDALNAAVPADGTITTAKLAGNLTVDLDSGSAASPSLTFDSNTGLYSPAGDEVSVATGGTERLRIDSTGQIGAVSLGTASAPVFSFTGDTNTGIYSPGADQVALTTGGTGRLFIDSSGRVGIGTSSPAVLLEASSATGSATPTPTEIRLSSTTNAADWSTTDPWARVGFYSADATGGARLRGAIDTIQTFTNGNVSSLAFKLDDASTGLVERMRLTYDGKVGIGSTAPDVNLVVEAATGDATIRVHAAENNSGSEPILILESSNDFAESIIEFKDSSGTGGGIRYNHGDNALRFQTNGTSERARIDSSGRLLVGTSSTSTNATMILQGYAADANDGGILRLATGKATPASGDVLGYLNFTDSTHTAGAQIRGERDGGTWSGSSKPGRLVFSTTADGASSPTERMRITQAGNVCVNTTSAGSANTQLTMGGGTTWQLGPSLTGTTFYVYNASDTGVYLSNGGTSWTGSSDERLKTALKPITSGLDKVSSLRAVTGRFISDEESVSRSFLIAQDVQAVLPEAVDATNEDSLGLRYTEIIPLLVAALKESKERIEQLESAVAALQAS